MTTEYANGVVSGEIVACKWVRLACERHLADLVTGAERGLYFDDEQSAWAIEFFPQLLRHFKGEWAGRPLTLEGWQCFIVGSLFGWKRTIDGARRFRVSYSELGRKNGKSTLAAGIGTLLAFFDDEPGAEVFAAATKRDQAKIVWGDARQMIMASPHIRKRVRVLQNNLNDPSSASKFEPLGADADSLDGLNIHGAIVDELHAHRTRAMWDVLATATAARRQPLIFCITTAGFDRHSVCREQHEYSTRVLEGVIEDDTLFAFIATIDEGDDWTDPESWAKANPNLGISVKVDDLTRKCARAQEVPGELNAFLRLHCSVWTEQSTRWLDMAVWDENAGADNHEVMAEELRGRDCIAGLDLSQKFDLTALELVFPGEDDDYDVLTFPFCPADNIKKRAERDRVPYPQWRDEGFLTATEGNVIDYAYIRQRLSDLASEYHIVEVAYDPWNAMQIAIQLQEDGFTCVPVQQSVRGLAEATTELERLLLARRLRHGGHPVLRWAASNVTVRQDASGNKRPDKERSTERIDPVTALITALARVITKPAETENWHGIYLAVDEEEETE